MAEAGSQPFRIAHDVESLVRARHVRFGDELTALVDTGVADAANDERNAIRWSSTINEETATWIGTWLNLAETEELVSFSTCVGSRHTLKIAMVGSDVVVGTEASGSTIFVALSAVETLQISTRRPAAGDREVDGIGMQSLLFQIAGERPEVSVRTFSGSMLTGVLLNVGADVLSIRSETGAVTALPISRVAEVVRYGH
jgi:hypothetical protein